MASIPLHPGNRSGTDGVLPRLSGRLWSPAHRQGTRLDGAAKDRGEKSARRGYWLVAVAALLTALGLSGCQGISSSTAQLRVIDASPDAGLIDSYQNNAALAYNLGFGTMTNYILMATGDYTLAVDKAGTRQTLVAGNQTLAAGKQYTQLIGGGLANLRQTILLDQSTPAPAGEIDLRVVNETTRSGAVDVYLVAGIGLGASGSSKSLSALPLAVNLRAGGDTGYITFPEGSYAVDVVAAGTPLISSTVTLLSGAQVEYASGAVRTIVLIDQQGTNAPHTASTPGVQAILGDDADAQ